MATNFAKDIEREIGALDAQRAAAQEQVDTIDKKIKYLRGLLELYAPPTPARRDKEKAPPPPGATRVIIPPEVGGPTGATGAAPTPERLAEEPSAEPPSIATTVMSVERPPGPAATSIPSEGPVRPPTLEQMRGSR